MAPAFPLQISPLRRIQPLRCLFDCHVAVLRSRQLPSFAAAATRTGAMIIAVVLHEICVVEPDGDAVLVVRAAAFAMMQEESVQRRTAARDAALFLHGLFRTAIEEPAAHLADARANRTHSA